MIIADDEDDQSKKSVSVTYPPRPADLLENSRHRIHKRSFTISDKTNNHTLTITITIAITITITITIKMKITITITISLYCNII